MKQSPPRDADAARAAMNELIRLAQPGHAAAQMIVATPGNPGQDSRMEIGTPTAHGETTIWSPWTGVRPRVVARLSGLLRIHRRLLLRIPLRDGVQPAAVRALLVPRCRAALCAAVHAFILVVVVAARHVCRSAC